MHDSIKPDSRYQGVFTDRLEDFFAHHSLIRSQIKGLAGLQAHGGPSARVVEQRVLDALQGHLPAELFGHYVTEIGVRDWSKDGNERKERVSFPFVSADLADTVLSALLGDRVNCEVKSEIVCVHDCTRPDPKDPKRRIECSEFVAKSHVRLTIRADQGPPWIVEGEAYKSAKGDKSGPIAELMHRATLYATTKARLQAYDRLGPLFGEPVRKGLRAFAQRLEDAERTARRAARARASLATKGDAEHADAAHDATLVAGPIDDLDLMQGRAVDDLDEDDIPEDKLAALLPPLQEIDYDDAGETHGPQADAGGAPQALSRDATDDDDVAPPDRSPNKRPIEDSAKGGPRVTEVRPTKRAPTRQSKPKTKSKAKPKNHAGATPGTTEAATPATTDTTAAIVAANRKPYVLKGPDGNALGEHATVAEFTDALRAAFAELDDPVRIEQFQAQNEGAVLAIHEAGRFDGTPLDALWQEIDAAITDRANLPPAGEAQRARAIDMLSTLGNFAGTADQLPDPAPGARIADERETAGRETATQAVETPAVTIALERRDGDKLDLQGYTRRFIAALDACIDEVAVNALFEANAGTLGDLPDRARTYLEKMRRNKVAELQDDDRSAKT